MLKIAIDYRNNIILATCAKVIRAIYRLKIFKKRFVVYYFSYVASDWASFDKKCMS